jgi:hypothetical protein
LTRLVGIAHQRVSVGNIQVVADERHSEWRVQSFKEDRSGLDRPVGGGTQQRNTIGARHACPCTTHHQTRDPPLDPFIVIGLGRRICLGYQYIAIGQHIKPARMVQALGEGSDAQAWGGYRGCALGPTLDGCDVDGRDQGRMWRRKLRGWSEAGGLRQRRLIPAGAEDDDRSDKDGATDVLAATAFGPARRRHVRR